MGVKTDEDLATILLLDALPKNFTAVKATLDAPNEFPKMSTVKSRLLEIGDKDEISDERGLKVKYFKRNTQKYVKNQNQDQQNSMSKPYFPLHFHGCGKRG